MDTPNQVQQPDSLSTSSIQPLPSSVTPIQSQAYQSPLTISPKPKSKLKIVLMIAGALMLLGAAGFGYLVLQGIQAAPEVKSKVSSFMRYISVEDLDKAYSLTSSEFRRVTTREDFDRAMGLFKAQYSDFQDQKQTGFSIEASAGQPTQIKYSGVITYGDGDKGDVVSVLIKEKDEWKIYYIKVNVNIDRIEKFRQQEKDSVLGVSTIK